MWRQADRNTASAVVLVNKMDVVGARTSRRTLKSIHSRLTPNAEDHGQPVPIIIPIGSGGPADSRTPFAGVIDLIEMKAKFFDARRLGKTVREADIPEDNALEAQDYREKMFDALTARRQATSSPPWFSTARSLTRAVRQLVRELCLSRKIYPVLAGSGREHIGVQPLLDAVTYLPTSARSTARRSSGPNPKGKKEQKRKPDPKEPFCGLVFKASWHPNGNRFFVRIYSRRDEAEHAGVQHRQGPEGEHRETLPRPRGPRACELEEVETAPAGDIVRLSG